MLDKQIVPSFEDLTSYCGETGALWIELDRFFKNEFNAKDYIRFPYGNKYGWSKKYSYKNKHICDVFAEKDAFMVLIRISSDAIEPIYKDLSDYGKAAWDNKYPCGSGGWLNYRVTCSKHLEDLIKIIEIKVKKKG